MRKKLQDLKDLPPLDPGIDAVDNYWYLIMYLRDLIKASEIKAGLVLSFYGLLMNVFFQFYEHLIELATSDYLTYGFMGTWFIFSVISIYYSLVSKYLSMRRSQQQSLEMSTSPLDTYHLTLA